LQHTGQADLVGLPTILDVLESIGRARRLAGSAVEVWQIVG
jgi:hypothetical protein